MHRLLLLAALAFATGVHAEPEEFKAATGKSGSFQGSATFRDPRPDPTSNGDVQHVHWSLREGAERITLALHESSFDAKDTPPLKTPGSYRISNETYPCRIVCNLSAQQANGLAAGPDFSKSSLVSGCHRIIVLDDAALSFAFELKRPVEIEVFELHSPARIVLDFRPLATSGNKFSVRTGSVAPGEAVGHLQERFLTNGFRTTRQLRCSDNRICIEAGLFPTRDEATAFAERAAAAGLDVFVEERAINDSPKAP